MILMLPGLIMACAYHSLSEQAMASSDAHYHCGYNLMYATQDKR